MLKNVTRLPFRPLARYGVNRSANLQPSPACNRSPHLNADPSPRNPCRKQPRNYHLRLNDRRTQPPKSPKKISEAPDNAATRAVHGRIRQYDDGGTRSGRMKAAYQGIGIGKRLSNQDVAKLIHEILLASDPIRLTLFIFSRLYISPGS